MAIARAALLLAVAAALGIALVSGGSDADPATPPPLPGQPPPFLGTAVTGYGGMTAAIDAYGDVVDLRATPAGPALIDNPAARQVAGTVPTDTGIVPRVAIDGGPAQPLWRADSAVQRYLPGTTVVRTIGVFGGGVRAVATTSAHGSVLAMLVRLRGPAAAAARAEVSVNVTGGGRCRSRRLPRGFELVCGDGTTPRASASAVLAHGVREGRRQLARARPLGPGAPTWARAMYRRSLGVLLTLTDRESGAVAAGARDGWAYVWPRDAATAALAYAAAGLGDDARRVARFLDRLPLERAARFEGDGAPVPGRGPQGDAAGWVAAADRAAGLRDPQSRAVHPGRGSSDHQASAHNAWRNLPDYQERSPGDYLGNALAATWAASSSTARAASASAAGTTRVDGPNSAPIGDFPAHRAPGASARSGALGAFVTPRGLVRTAGERSSGLDSAAAWAVRPFATPALYPAARRTLLRLLRGGTRFGITPGQGWTGGPDPWMAPTAAGAWALATLGERDAALHLLGDLRRASTPAGDLPERVDATSGVPRSTTPLAWPHAFTILALRRLWP